MLPDKLFESVVEAFRTRNGVTIGRMFGSPGLRIDGKVFAMLVKGKLVVKLPGERVQGIVSAGQGDYFNPGHGRLSKEWVAINPSHADQWLNLAEEAEAFVTPSR